MGTSLFNGVMYDDGILGCYEMILWSGSTEIAESCLGPPSPPSPCTRDNEEWTHGPTWLVQSLFPKLH